MVYKFVSEMLKDDQFEAYIKAKQDGRLFIRVKNFIKPYYFAIQKSNLEGNRCRTINSFTNETIKQIERRYSTSGNL